MRIKKKSLFILATLLLMGRPVLAQEFRELYNNARSLGMGGASVAVTNDETSVLSNPAALGRLRDYYGTIFDPEVDMSSAAFKKYQASSLQGATSVSGAKEVADGDRGTYFHNRQQLFPSLVMKYVGIGLLYTNTLDAEMNAAGDNLNVFYRNDMTAVIGASVKFLGGRIKIGGNAKAISRIEVQNSAVNPTGSLAIKDIGATEGLGLGLDGGILLTAPWQWLPTIGAVVRDIGGTTFDRKKGLRLDTTDIPQMQKQSIDVGVALFPIHSNNFRAAWTVEYKDVANAREESDTAKKIHAGVEWNWGDIFFMRAGYNQRYVTGGLELASEYLQWQIATYGEEIGTVDAPREDRRYVVKVAVRF